MFKNLVKELLHLKELSAIFALLFGFGLTLAGFIVSPLGIVDDSVLWTLGQILFYVGSIFGISTHYSTKQQELENVINNKLSKLK